MARPRVGHGRTIIAGVWSFMDCMGTWHSTGEAVGWPRCSKCRKPEKTEDLINGLCCHCHFYGARDAKWFWEQKENRLFPYTIGKRMTDTIRSMILSPSLRKLEIRESQRNSRAT